MTSYVWKGTPDEESRQQYATRRVQEYQAACAEYEAPPTFEDLRSAFVFAGRQFDAGMKVAA